MEQETRLLFLMILKRRIRSIRRIWVLIILERTHLLAMDVIRTIIAIPTAVVVTPCIIPIMTVVTEQNHMSQEEP